jgi:hypothetical protein
VTGETHYDLEVLAELAEDLLDAATARRVREHLAVCDPCGARLADLAAVREVLAATPTPAMPMGVALRIDKALAAEAGSRRGGIGLVEAPDWDELMRDAPWEQPAQQVPEPVSLGVVADDGTVVPARHRTARRRRWAMPAAAASAAAAVVVVGTLALSGGLLAGGGSDGSTGASVAAQPAPSTDHLRAAPYALTDSNHNYSDQELRDPLLGYVGMAPILDGPTDTARVQKCVDQVANRSNLKTLAVDQGQYNGQEALIVASWKDQAANKLRIDIVDPFNCKNLRKPMLGRW